MIYIISHWAPYEGMAEVFQGTKEQCIQWFQNQYFYNLQDLTVYIEGPETVEFFTGNES